jgi:hypothetical protein
MHFSFCRFQQVRFQHVLNLPLRIKRLVKAVILCAFCAAGLPRPGRK